MRFFTYYYEHEFCLRLPSFIKEQYKVLFLTMIYVLEWVIGVQNFDTAILIWNQFHTFMFIAQFSIVLHLKVVIT